MEGGALPDLCPAESSTRSPFVRVLGLGGGDGFGGRSGERCSGEWLEVPVAVVRWEPWMEEEGAGGGTYETGGALSGRGAGVRGAALVPERPWALSAAMRSEMEVSGGDEAGC